MNYDASKLPIALFDLLVFMVCGWCIDLNDCDVERSRGNPTEVSLLEMGMQQCFSAR